MAETLFLFLRDLWASWIAWAGGILRMIPFIESLVKPLLRKWPRADNYIQSHADTLKTNLKRLALLCLFIGCYRAWVFEHDNAQTAMYGKDGKAEAWSKFNQCDGERSGLRTLTNTQGNTLTQQQSTITQQQATMNSCVLALGKSNTPEPLKISAKLVGLPITSEMSGGHKKQVAVLIAEPNKTVTPVRALVECDMPFESLGIALAGETWMTTSGHQQLSENKATWNIDSPAWRPTTPLVVTIATVDRIPKMCTVTQRQ